MRAGEPSMKAIAVACCILFICSLVMGVGGKPLSTSSVDLGISTRDRSDMMQGKSMEPLKLALLSPEDLGSGFGTLDESMREEPPQAFRVMIALEPEVVNVYVSLTIPPAGQ